MISRLRPSNPRGARPRRGGPDADERGARSSRGRATILTLTICGLATACLSGGATPGDGDAIEAGDLEKARDRRIEVLEAEIARDRRQLADLVADPTVENEQALHENPTLRALAARISERADELERLRIGLDGQATAR